MLSHGTTLPFLSLVRAGVQYDSLARVRAHALSLSLSLFLFLSLSFSPSVPYSLSL